MRLLLASLFLTFPLQCAQAEDGLFIGKPAPEKESIQNGILITQLPLERLQVNAVSLRPDSEDPKLFWLELYLPEFRDPGDFIYRLVAEGKILEGQMVVRSSELNQKGCKWAMEVKDPSIGKAIQKALIMAYKIKTVKPSNNSRQKDAGASSVPNSRQSPGASAL